MKEKDIKEAIEVVEYLKGIIKQEGDGRVAHEGNRCIAFLWNFLKQLKEEKKT